GVRIYFNGALRATNPYIGSFASIGNGSQNFLGYSNWKQAGQSLGDEDFQGQMDEVRVWNHGRTAEQIRANLFTTLTGKESGLMVIGTLMTAPLAAKRRRDITENWWATPKSRRAGHPRPPATRRQGMLCLHHQTAAPRNQLPAPRRNKFSTT